MTFYLCKIPYNTKPLIPLVYKEPPLSTRDLFFFFNDIIITLTTLILILIILIIYLFRLSPPLLRLASVSLIFTIRSIQLPTLAFSVSLIRRVLISVPGAVSRSRRVLR